MRFTAVLALVAAATVVSAATNAERFARGMPPKAPGKRATRVARDSSPQPSNAPSNDCNTGPINCCDSLQEAHSGGHGDDLLQLLGLLGSVQPGTPIGINCSPLTAVGVGSGATCVSQTVCCENNRFTGLINIACSPIYINNA